MQYKNVKLFFGILSVLTRNKNQNIYLLFFFFKKESKMNKKTENHKIISLKNEPQTVKDIHSYG